jgi:hypothetical protein
MLLFLAFVGASFPFVDPSAAVSSANRSEVRRAIDRHETIRGEMSLAAARDGTARDATIARGAAGKLPLKAGDLLTASTFRQAVLRLKIDESRARVKRASLDTEFIPRGVAVDNNTGVLAIGAVSRVLIYDTASGLVDVLTEPEGPGSAFGYVNAVLFDRNGLLIIADQGIVIGSKEPADGRLWSYDRTTGQFARLAERKLFSDPKLLALDGRGRILVVDGNSGALVTPLLDVRYDVVWRLTGRLRKGARAIFADPGLQATAFAVHPDEAMWFGSTDQIVIINGKSMTKACPASTPLSFVTGVAVSSAGGAFVLDGAAVVTNSSRSIYEIDANCTLTERLTGRRVAESRGLALYEPTDG